jgi:hypothetical protein
MGILRRIVEAVLIAMTTVSPLSTILGQVTVYSANLLTSDQDLPSS